MIYDIYNMDISMIHASMSMSMIWIVQLYNVLYIVYIVCISCVAVALPYRSYFKETGSTGVRYSYRKLRLLQEILQEPVEPVEEGLKHQRL